MSTTTILVDGNSIGYTEHYATKLRSGDLETQAVFGFVRKMREMRVGYPSGKPIVLWDGRAQWRYDLWPQYKSNREADKKKMAIRERYVEQRPYIARALEHLGVTQMTGLDCEADDLAGYLVKSITEQNPTHKIVLLTGDHDWYQLVRDNVIVRDNLEPDKIIKHTNLLDKTGYKTALAFLEGKALQGDGSDTIPGIEKLGDGTAQLLLAEWGSMSNFFKAVDSGSYTPKARKDVNAKTIHPEQALASRAGREIFHRNLKLMQLIKVAKPPAGSVKLIKGRPDKAKFAEVCEELAFASILKNLDAFFLPFEN